MSEAKQARAALASRRGKVSFEGYVPMPRPGPDDIVPLDFVVRLGSRTMEVIFSTYPVPGIASGFARIVKRECEPDGHYGSIGNLENVLSALRRFGECILDRGRSAEVIHLNDIAAEDIAEYEPWLLARYPEGSNTPYSYMMLLKQVIGFARLFGLVGEHLDHQLSFVATIARPSSRARPLDAFSPYVAHQLKEAFIKDIEATIERITVLGPRMAGEGRDPAAVGWKDHRNVAWAMLNTGLESPKQAPRCAQKFLRSMKEYGQPYHFSELIALFHLTASDIFVFASYISLATGIPIECAYDLEKTCLSNVSERYATLEYLKRRRAGEERGTERISARGRLSPASLIKIVIRLTTLTRAKVKSKSPDWLFVGYTRNGPDYCKRIRDIEPETIKRFCARHRIVDDDGTPMTSFEPRRLRKTYKAERYVHAAGRLTEAAKDHSHAIHVRHYADVPQLKHLHEQAIEDGLRQAYEAAMAPIVLNAGQERAIQLDPSSAAAHGLSLEEGQAVTDGSQGVWVADCRNHEDSPFKEKEGEPCPCPIWGCLGCRNAIIGSSRLPAVLALLNFVESERPSLTETRWNKRYGLAHARITKSILPRFPRREVDLARAVVEADGPLVWLPAELPFPR